MVNNWRDLGWYGACSNLMSNFIRNSRNLESHPLQAASGKLQVLHFLVLFSLPFESGASIHSFFSVGIFPWLFPLCQVCQISEPQDFWKSSLCRVLDPFFDWSFLVWWMFFVQFVQWYCIHLCLYGSGKAEITAHGSSSWEWTPSYGVWEGSHSLAHPGLSFSRSITFLPLQQDLTTVFAFLTFYCLGAYDSKCMSLEIKSCLPLMSVLSFFWCMITRKLRIYFCSFVEHFSELCMTVIWRLLKLILILLQNVLLDIRLVTVMAMR